MIVRRDKIWAAVWAGAMFFSGPVFAGEVLTWDDCVRETVRMYPGLIAAREGVVQSRADKAVNASGFLPQISSRLGWKRSKAAAAAAADSYSYSLLGEQLIFDGFKTSSRVGAAAKTLDAQQYNYAVTSSNVRLNLRVAFAALLKAQELTFLTEEIALRRKDNLALVRVRYEAGKEHKGAVMTAEADLAQAEFEVAQAARNLVLAQQSLITNLGRKERGTIRVSGNFELEDPDEDKPDCALLADNTPLLKELIARKEAARYGERSALADFSPQVYWSGSVGKSRSRWPPKEEEWSSGVTLTLPLFEGGSRIAQLDKAKSQFRQAEANERSGRDEVIYTLEKTWKDLQDAAETVSVRKRFLDAALERAKIANAQYSSGLISFDDWVIIEDSLVNAKKAFLDAEENALVAEASWVQARGEMLEHV